MDRIRELMVTLRLCNECETAAEMDVADASANVEIYERKLAAVQFRHTETVEASYEAGVALSTAVNQMVEPPLLVVVRAEEHDE
jgi:transcription elongation factor Elf1